MKAHSNKYGPNEFTQAKPNQDKTDKAHKTYIYIWTESIHDTLLFACEEPISPKNIHNEFTYLTFDWNRRINRISVKYKNFVKLRRTQTHNDINSSIDRYILCSTLSVCLRYAYGMCAIAVLFFACNIQNYARIILSHMLFPSFFMQEFFFSLKLTESIEQKKREIDFEIDRIKNNNFSSLVFKFNGILMSMYAFDSVFMCVWYVWGMLLSTYVSGWQSWNAFFISFFSSPVRLFQQCARVRWHHFQGPFNSQPIGRPINLDSLDFLYFYHINRIEYSSNSSTNINIGIFTFWLLHQLTTEANETSEWMDDRMTKRFVEQTAPFYLNWKFLFNGA